MALTQQQVANLASGSELENLWFEYVTIANGTATSNGFPTQGRAVVGIIVEGTWTTANMGFQASLDGVNYYDDVIDSGGNLIQCVPDSGCDIAFPQSNAIFRPFLRLHSVVADSTTDAAQGQATPVIVALRRFVGGS